jgi:hypothetical protein
MRVLLCLFCREWRTLPRQRGGSNLRCDKCHRRGRLTDFSRMLLPWVNDGAPATREGQ